jgi:hypothetical protein
LLNLLDFAIKSSVIVKRLHKYRRTDKIILKVKKVQIWSTKLVDLKI